MTAPDPASGKHRAVDTFLALAACASALARQIWEWCPIAGTPWDSDVLEAHVVNNAINAAVGLERALRSVPRSMRGVRQCVHDALAAVQRCHDRVLTHYHWRDLVEGRATTWPWEWPSVPPIAPALVDALDKSASRLAGFAGDFASRQLLPSGATDGKSNHSATELPDREGAATEDDLPMPPALMSAPDLARYVGLSEDQVDSFLRRYRV
jgi:hypothetical protein